MEKRLLFIFLYFFSFGAASQGDTLKGPVNISWQGIIDGIYIEEHLPLRRGYIPYDALKHDYTWNRRIWRSIDRNSAGNEAYFEPLLIAAERGKSSLWEVMKQLVMSGSINVYHPRHPLTQEDVENPFRFPLHVTKGMNFETDSLYATEVMEYGLLSGEEPRKLVASRLPPYGDSVVVTDGQMFIVYEPAAVKWYASEDIVQYHLLEDWYFDKDRSVVDVQILGIAPVIVSEVDGQEEYRPLFWLYYPECVPEFKNCSLPGNPFPQKLETLFLKRKFRSSIGKELNVLDLDTKAYNAYMQSMWEMEKLKDKCKRINEGNCISGFKTNLYK